MRKTLGILLSILALLSTGWMIITVNNYLENEKEGEEIEEKIEKTKQEEQKLEQKIKEAKETYDKIKEEKKEEVEEYEKWKQEKKTIKEYLQS